MCQRLRHIAKKATNSDNEALQTAVGQISPYSVLDGIHVLRVFDCVEMLSVVINLNEYIMREKLRGVEFGLIVVDSISYPFRASFSQRASKRVNQLLNIANYLNKIATAHNIAVVLTNHITTRFDPLNPGEGRHEPALGEAWAHVPATRLKLGWSGGLCQLNDEQQTEGTTGAGGKVEKRDPDEPKGVIQAPPVEAERMIEMMKSNSIAFHEPILFKITSKGVRDTA
eukprot:GHVN01051936.1.p1 GENE.GHVN01051936.1~~GHVN01051936.1.p1  ORF type:complete len:227 (+),score=33.39 GHVN01051936.1:430-1110(+)